MQQTEDLESYLIQMGLPYEHLGEGTWMINPSSVHSVAIAIKVSAPILMASVRLFPLERLKKPYEPLFRRLLEFNAGLLHGAYALQGDQVVLSSAQQLANLDYNEFQAMIDDLCMAIDRHYKELLGWIVERPSKDVGVAGSGSAKITSSP